MEYQLILFYFLSAIILTSSIAMILIRNTVNSALLLVFIFFNTAIIWLLLNAEFLAILLVLVYVGAVLVLFLFVVMMLSEHEKQIPKKNSYIFLSSIVGLTMFVELLLIILSGNFNIATPVINNINVSNTSLLGIEIYTNHLISFEITAFILLVAIIAAIAITYSKKKKVLRQNTETQINATKADRLKIMKD
ncbi:MAG: NADH-quinone oxidoreductase subunit J [Pseudomonadota bacterium]|nr:NADH-quinone oxidoreductase subunit J [Pseudomonadota bacterium]|tara:strand:+ start:3583 stop:4158 length:576 start_codon:yes stop_codon:yes gene_type:complete